MLQSKVASSTLKDSFEAGKAGAGRIAAELNGVKIVYMYSSVAYDQQSLLDGVKASLGDVPVIGNTSFTGVITPEGYIGGETFVGLMALADPELTVGVAGLPKTGSARATGRKVAELALQKAGKNRKPDFFYMVAPPGEEEYYLKGISEVIGRIPLFGGSAADNSISGEWLLFTQAGAFADGVAVALFYSDKAFANEFTGAYRETGKYGIITKIAGDRTLVEIDGVPAVDKYIAWQGCAAEATIGGKLLVTAITAPLGVKDPLGDLIAVRHPMNGNADHSMAIGSNLAVGTAVGLLAASVDELIGSTGTTLEKLKTKLGAPAGAFHIVHCGGRRAGMGDRVSEVYDHLKAAAGDVPFLAEFTFGEYGSVDDGRNTCGGLMLSFTGFGK
ncbi:MAG: FIST signal transduction protein [Negativicutes bacterium]